MIDPALYTPSKRMRMMTGAFATSSSGSFLVSKEPLTSQSRLPAPVLEGPPTTIPQPDWTSLAMTDQDLESMSKSQLIEAGRMLRQNLGLANQHIAARDGIIESAHATIVLQNVFVERQSEALHAKETKKQSARVRLSMDGVGRHLTSKEWIQKTKDAQDARDAEVVARAQKADEREAARIAKEALEKEWKEAKAAHELAVVAWEEECKKLLSGGSQKKDLPKKPTRPKKPKARELEEPSGPPQEPDSDSDDD
ncbi:hypothetical protein DFH07DRAFT_771594 [Mycena maculata]|uniref:Uncharacterized protein n=1 Tax=Mycena maculata TaxID=230809 RepID=A0AAD7JBE1_9AGAR|nr:hypothetical protein DFH07DRAFT_771594 [Mycena maculata]